jgi:hypothetical protein
LKTAQWIELNNAIVSSGTANVEAIEGLMEGVKSRTLLKQLVSSEVHSRLVVEVGRTLVEDCARRVTEQAARSEPPTEIRALGLKLDAQYLKFVTAHLRAMADVKVSSGFAGMMALAKLLVKSATTAILPYAEMVTGLKELLDAMAAVRVSVDKADSSLLRWEAFDQLAFDTTVVATLYVEGFTRPFDEESLSMSLDALMHRARASAIHRVETAFNEIRAKSPPQVWTPPVHGFASAFAKG